MRWRRKKAVRLLRLLILFPLLNMVKKIEPPEVRRFTSIVDLMFHIYWQKYAEKYPDTVRFIRNGLKPF